MAKGCTQSPAPQRHAERARLRGMPEERQRVAAFADLPHLRPRRLLRRFAQQARHQAFPCHRASDHRGLRSARRLGLVLCRRGAVRSVRTERLRTTARSRATTESPFTSKGGTTDAIRDQNLSCRRRCRVVGCLLDPGSGIGAGAAKQIRRRQRRQAALSRSPARAIPSCCCTALPKPATCGCR